MDARFVYGVFRDPTKFIYWGTLSRATAEAHEHGYSFVLFNGLVYFVLAKGEYFVTPIKETDIFCHLK